MAPAVLPNILDMAIWRRSQPDSLLRRSDHVAPRRLLAAGENYGGCHL
jgi:hypothetical protein